MTDSATNVVKSIQKHQSGKPSGIVWVQFAHAEVGEETSLA